MNTIPFPRPLTIDPARNLPALPAAVLELLDLLDRDDVEISTLAAKIALDPALAAKTLRLANSSFYGLQRHVSSLTEAASVLGLRSVHTIVTTAALRGSFAPPACDGFELQSFWRHAVATAVSSKLIANAVGIDAEAAFSAGLLHDIGRLVLASGFPDRYAEVLAHGDTRGVELSDREQALLGIDHVSVGALVAEQWRLPKVVADAIAGHHSSPAIGKTLDVGGVVFLADHLVQALEISMPRDGLVPAACVESWIRLGLSSDSCTQVFEEAERQTDAICAALIN